MVRKIFHTVVSMLLCSLHPYMDLSSLCFSPTLLLIPQLTPSLSPLALCVYILHGFSHTMLSFDLFISLLTLAIYSSLPASCLYLSPTSFSFSISPAFCNLVPHFFILSIFIYIFATLLHLSHVSFPPCYFSPSLSLSGTSPV